MKYSNMSVKSVVFFTFYLFYYKYASENNIIKPQVTTEKLSTLVAREKHLGS